MEARVSRNSSMHTRRVLQRTRLFFFSWLISVAYLFFALLQLPIRRLSHPNPVRTVELIRKELETYALVFPNVAFSLENSAKEKENGKGRITTINQVDEMETGPHYGLLILVYVDYFSARSVSSAVWSRACRGEIQCSIW
jgi:hypothetical protein